MYLPADHPGMGTEGESTEGTKEDRASADTTTGGRTGNYSAPGETGGGTGDATGDEPWHANRQARALVAVDLALTLAVVAGTTELLDDVLGLVGLDASPLAVTVPWHVYVFAALGGLGYVFTMLICYDAGPGNVFHANLRVPAALPLAAGIYLLVVQLLGEVPTTRLLAGLAFVTGLYVNRAYERIGDLADRLLAAAGPADEEPGDGRDSGAVETGDDGARRDRLGEGDDHGTDGPGTGGGPGGRPDPRSDGGSDATGS